MRYLTWFPVEQQLPQISSVPDYENKGIEYQGSPRKHPYDSQRILLLAHLFEKEQQICYDFSLNDVLHIEELENVVSFEGESIRLLRIWVRKGSQAFQLTPMEVH
ncbi:hypothetical protein [Salinispira pacifica]|uniref:Inorganic pyrophosphatase Ppa n=1 Tax=Salinispira pacifica TaxID=1307761 RepID=V5WJX5_9SPIO|nr:hypothetical protein [Salinispira pacifica]AHC15476.1 hypothetical protein L21SP2_2109 [Salinispira pacifica]